MIMVNDWFISSWCGSLRPDTILFWCGRLRPDTALFYVWTASARYNLVNFHILYNILL